MADAETAPSSPRDVFGNVEPLLTPKPQPAHHTREPQKVDDSPPLTPIFTPLRLSRRTQSVDLPAKHPNVPSPLGPSAVAVRRKRGERERERIKAELDAAPGLTLDPRIAHDVLDLERRFAAASKGKSTPSRPHRSHRHRHSVHAPRTENLALSAVTEPHTIANESDTSNFSGGHELVGPALPSSAVQSLAPSPPPPQHRPLAEPELSPTPIKVEKAAYSALLPNADSDAPSGSGADAKRTSKAAKRHSLTAMLGLGSRKKHKDLTHDDDKDRLSSPPSLRPPAQRGDTHQTTRTFNTILTTNTGATAGSVEADRVSNGVRSVSATSSNPGLVVESPMIEPSAKTLARAAATRDQLSKRYGMLYASLGDAGESEESTRSVSGSGSILKRASPGPSVDSHPRPSSKEHAPLKARGLNPLEVVRWRSGMLSRARQSAEAARERTGEVWERETERRVRDGFPAPASLGDSLPEANALGWLPYLEPVFAEERARAEGTGAYGLGGRLEDEVPTSMSAWYILASFVEGYAAAKEQDERLVLEELGMVRGADGSFGSDGLTKSIGSDGPKSFGSEVQSRLLPPDFPHPKTITSDVRAQAIVNAAKARNAGPDAHALSDDASNSRFGGVVSRALRGAGSRRNSVIVDGVRSRGSSVGFGTTSEPPSPSHMSSTMFFAGPGSSSQLYVGPRPAGASRLAAPRHSEPRAHSRTHSRSQSQSRSISAGNPGLKSGEFHPKPFAGASGDGKSMSPASSRLNLAGLISGIGRGMLRNGRQTIYKEGMSGSENERMSSDISDQRAMASDGENGRVKGRRKTWREREQGAVPLSDGGIDVDVDVRRRSLRLEKTVMVPFEVLAEKTAAKEGKEGSEKEHARKQALVEEAQETLVNVDLRLLGFTQLLSRLNTVHKEGSDVFGEMFMDVPQQVVSILTPELTDDDSTHIPSPVTPNLTPLFAFSKQLEKLEATPAAVDHIGRSTLDASLPIAAFDTLHEFEYDLNLLSRQLGDVRRLCDHAEDERQVVRQLYESTAGNVGTTYPECAQIEHLLGSLVTEDMPWLPSWLPLWVRHLLEIFSNQIQFMVENGLRIYGYGYALVSLLVLPFTLVCRVVFMLARFVRAYWWGFLAAGLAAVAYLMVQSPEGMVLDMGL